MEKSRSQVKDADAIHPRTFVSFATREARGRARLLRAVFLNMALCFLAGFLFPLSSKETVSLALCVATPGTIALLWIEGWASKVRLKSFLLTSAFQTAVYMGLLFFVILLPLVTWMQLSGFAKAHNFPLDLLREVYRRFVWVFWGGVATVILLLTFTKLIVRKIGPANLWNTLRGYYHQPRQEVRVFMFLDVRDSTPIAERLGDLGFSSFMRDFFEDMTGPIIESCGEISHYIGDELVISWKPAKGLHEANCLTCFFHGQQIIEDNADYYRERYGMVPEFKAGAHIGTVVATEVGQVKSEIVFHGDVLNTTSRIQSMCNSLAADLVLSQDLANQLELPDWLCLDAIGSVSLKGKAEPLYLFSARVADEEE